MKKHLISNDKEYLLGVKSKCVFEEKNCSYIREEKYGYITISPKQNNIKRELLLNNTCKQILNFSDGENTISDIYSKLVKLYSNVDKELIYTDLINALFDLTNQNLVVWEGENPFMVTMDKVIEDCKLRFATENDLHKIVDFIRNTDSNINKVGQYNLPLNRLGNLELEIRHRLFALSEEFFILERNGMMEGLLSLRIPINLNTTAAKVEIIKGDLDDISLLIDYAIEILNKICISKITKVSVDIYDEIKSKEILNIFETRGFKREGLLIKEFNDIDILRLSYIY